MKICAIDSSGLVASVSIIEDEITIAEYSIQYKITHSQTLLPMLDEICKRIDLDFSDIDYIAVAAGPGSFTGLRIGIATVKGLGIAVDKPVISVPTLEALAFNAYGSESLVCPIMDARRHQVYTGVYSFPFNENEHRYEMRAVMKQTACDFGELCDKLNGLGRNVLFIGDGIPVYEQEMSSSLHVPYSVAPAHMNRQRAGSLAALSKLYITGLVEGLEGQLTDADNLTPEYLRMSQAEREKKEQSGEA